MSAPDQSPSFQVGTLSQEKYSSLQDFANDFCRKLSILFPTGFLSRKGDTGSSGTTIVKTAHSFPVPNGTRTINVGFDPSQCAIVLTTTSGSPTVGVLCVNGQLVILTGNVPDVTYTLVVTQFERGA